MGMEYCSNGIYSPAFPKTKEGAKLLAEAAKRNTQRDKIDRESGHVAPPDLNILEYLRNAMSAIGSGISSKDLDSCIAWECVAEGMAMLFDIESRMREAE